jgi:hypothetical protein
MKTLSTLLALTALTLSAGCASVRTIDQDEYQTYTLNDIRSHPGLVAQALADDADGLVVSVTEGEILPLDLFSVLPFATLVAGDNWIKFDRNVWFLFFKDDLLISPDGERFGAIYDPRALKELFGMKGGQLSIGFGMSKAKGARISVLLLAK